jgi:hypothetical protein
VHREHRPDTSINALNSIRRHQVERGALPSLLPRNLCSNQAGSLYGRFTTTAMLNNDLLENRTPFFAEYETMSIK